MEFRIRPLKDVNDLSVGMRGWEQVYRQMSPGFFSGVAVQAETSEFQFFREKTSRRVCQTGVTPGHFSSIAVPLEAGASGTFQGLRFDGFALLLLGEEEEFRMHTSEAFHYCGVSLPSDVISMLSSAVTDGEMEFSSRSSVHSLKLSQGTETSGRLLSCFAQVERTPGMLQNPVLLKRIRDEMLSVLLDLLVPGNRVERDLTHTTYADIVRRSEKLLQADSDAAVTVLDLCVALRCSRRTLQTSFQRVANVSPVEYLRMMRLNGVRRLLRSTSQNELGVGDAAAKWGFTHASYFAREYRSLFGELPSQTARQS
ncbi:AraC family transcriptional regulator [Caballeronia hypogeia]|uniref:AraC family transcriptional regulator n=1 Tax=Caballeronia hypogeia TaxID=1777140 RepID=A0A158CYK7_9BURK|nr:helix-turn-helix domain-containing protein [Caballeronia hypogeia]SAK87448.1 AraC family transcriptional regulator [Caballeronia hypogeia]